MLRLYKKSLLGFSLVWIGMYVVGFSLADGFSEKLGIAKIITAPLGIVLSILLLIWLYRHDLARASGLRAFRGSGCAYLWFIPLVVISSCNLWLGVGMQHTVLETALYMLSMLCVGFLEEVIFRGFLYRAMRDEGTRCAILISGVTFGIGHIVNLLNGAEFLPTLMQICYATAIGVLFTVIYHKSGSLVPCIISHCAVNMLSVFAVERGYTAELAVAAALTVVPLLYTLWIWKRAD
ncbi:MAG: CPBP family intramembrane metalloprotease [Clostridia bacterium]|nr:CPBP family intramembrane metalloprotease [Clostridia bacterium]